ncbi:MAG: nucleotidyltransferase family protein [Oscillospiraceae bacterium]|nr:nucleotidyltransferase family protein [Oscillospiraceae bacterium]
MSELEKISEKIKPVAKKYNLTYVWIFGSYVRKNQKPNSDIDILVKTEDVAEGFKIVEVKFALEKVLEKEVDIITTGSIKGSLLEGEDLEEVLIYSSNNKR